MRTYTLTAPQVKRVIVALRHQLWILQNMGNDPRVDTGSHAAEIVDVQAALDTFTREQPACTSMGMTWTSF